MKKTKPFAVIAVIMLLAAACTKSGENYVTGISELKTSSQYLYANNFSDTLCLTSYGPWLITKVSDDDWCTVSLMKGYGGASVSIPLSFTENTTGSVRRSTFKIEDIEHPSDTHVSWSFQQLATRGDGTMGNAAMVKSVIGDDGSSISVSYDSHRRPVTLEMKKGTETLCDLKFAYSGEVTGTMTVTGTHGTMSANYANDYQPNKTLVSSSDTVRLMEQGSFNYFSSRYAFSVVHSMGSNNYKGYSFLLKNFACLAPDSIHNVDSLRYISVKGGKTDELILMKPSYSAIDNRCQSLDVNQLVLGVERCNPYMLLSLFRYARNSNVFSTVETNASEITVAAERNSDNSIKKLKVTNGTKVVNYDFIY